MKDVERDGSSSPDISIPSTYWVLDVKDWSLEFDPKCFVSGALIRDEYKEALQAVLSHYRTGNFHFPTSVVGEAMEVDIENRPFANPFLDLSADFVSEMGAFILLGHPGIGDLSRFLNRIESYYIPLGKTIWLYLALVLRLEAGLPTIFQSLPNRLFFFNDEGVHILKYSLSASAMDFKAEFPPSTWCLVDSNLELNTVPGFIRNLSLFVVQASSPRPERIEWEKKEQRASLEYFLKPWTPSELIMGCVRTMHLQHVYP